MSAAVVNRVGTQGLATRSTVLHRRPAPPRAAFVTFDLIAAGALTLVFLAVLATAGVELSRSYRDGEARRQLRGLAEAELAQMRAGLVALPSVGETRTRETSGCHVEITASPGAGEWDWFACVRVVAQRQVQGRAVSVQLAGFIPYGKAAP